MYRKAAEGDLASAQTLLAKLYFEGKGVPQDYAQGVEWLRRAAEQGESTAQNALGCAYLKGRGVKPDARKAAEWIEKAAEQGYPLAEGNLGYLFQRGEGVTLDYPEAYKWYQLAAAHGSAQAKRATKSLAEIMTARQVQEGQVRISLWHERNATSAQSSDMGEMGRVSVDGVRTSD
jgi:TPR repeat protein